MVGGGGKWFWGRNDRVCVAKRQRVKIEEKRLGGVCVWGGNDLREGRGPGVGNVLGGETTSYLLFYGFRINSQSQTSPPCVKELTTFAL